jgi:ABC-type antimicrobial peptide transport system permease subunit
MAAPLAGMDIPGWQSTDIQSHQILLVDSNFFTTFSFPLIAGNPATALRQPHSLVVSEEFARLKFGTTDALGKIIQVKTDSGIALFILLIACINFVNLTIARSLRRPKEIGIRKVLAASVSGLVAGLSTDFVRLVALALLISLPTARWAATKWLANYPYHVNPGFWLFAGTALLVIAIAVVAVGFQALKAALANPVQSLRAE